MRQWSVIPIGRPSAWSPCLIDAAKGDARSHAVGTEFMIMCHIGPDHRLPLHVAQWRTDARVRGPREMAGKIAPEGCHG